MPGPLEPSTARHTDYVGVIVQTGGYDDVRFIEAAAKLTDVYLLELTKATGAKAYWARNIGCYPAVALMLEPGCRVVIKESRIINDGKTMTLNLGTPL